MTAQNYKNYSTSNTDALINLKTVTYTKASGETDSVTMFPYGSDVADVTSLISLLTSAYANAEKSKTDISIDTSALASTKATALKNVEAFTVSQIKSVTDYTSSITMTDTEHVDVNKMQDIFNSGITEISKSCMADINTIADMSNSIILKISTYNKIVLHDPITSLNNTYASNINNRLSSITAKISAIRDASHEDAPQDVYAHMLSAITALADSFVGNIVLVETAGIKLIEDYNNSVTYTSDIVSCKKNLSSSLTAITNSAKAALDAAKTERQNADISLAQAKSNYEAAKEKYRNSKGGRKTIEKAASNLGNSYKTGATSPNSFLKSDYANRTNNSPSLFLSRLKLTADEPMYYIDKEGVEHYNPKYIKMFTKQYPDGIIYEGYFRSFNIVETPDFETVDYDFVFVAEKGTPVTFMQRVLGMYSGYTSVAGDAMNVIGV